MRLIANLALLAALVAGPAIAADFVLKDLKIGHPWTRETAKGMTAGAYLTVTNRGTTPDVLLSVQAPIAKTAGLHRSAVTNGVATMRPITGGIAIPAGKTITLDPGGDHVMLTGLKQAIVEGHDVPLTLVFQKAGRIKVGLMVHPNPNALGVKAPAADPHAGHH